MKRQHKSKGATVLLWGGPRTGTETPEANGVLLYISSVTNCHIFALLTCFRPSSVGLGGPSKSWLCAAGGSVQHQPTLPPARPVRVTPATTGCCFHNGTTTTCPRAACALTAKPRVWLTPSQSSSRRHPRAARLGKKLWTIPSSAGFERKPIAKEKETTGEVRADRFLKLCILQDNFRNGFVTLGQSSWISLITSVCPY